MAIAFLVSAPGTHGQTTTQALDLGPRDPGTSPFVSHCPNGGPSKFSPNCVDLAQPPSQPPQPLADGAGNLIGQFGTITFGNEPLAAMWGQSIPIFQTVASVTGSVSGEPMPGLGPSFNSNSCGSCHSQPAVGGTSPGIITINTTRGLQTFMSVGFRENPELIAASDQGGTSQNPMFPSGSSFSGPGFTDVPFNGPVIEVRFVNGLLATGNAAAVQPGGVGELFTFQGRSDEPPNCSISQLNFAGVGQKSLGFRIPTPTFGVGLVENTPELILQSNLSTELAATASIALGIKGSLNRNGNDGTITRFGWKAQNKSLMIFAGEASNVEMGVTNELFPNEKSWGSGLNCISNNQPEDEILPPGFPNAVGDASVISSVAQNNAVFMRLNAAPSQCDALLATVVNGVATCPAFSSSAVINGQNLFSSPSVGCNLCHTPTLTTAPSPNSPLSNQIYHPYSDFALHHMGAGDADGVTQGLATSDQFRTAPLWGAGQRYFFLHDGRAIDLPTAIQDHCPPASQTSSGTIPVGEACGSVRGFNALSVTNQQAILDFLRSL